MPQPLKTITGILLPHYWDALGNITEFALATFEEEEYLLVNSPSQESLLPNLRKTVEVTGMQVVENGMKALSVMQLKTLEPA